MFDVPEDLKDPRKKRMANEELSLQAKRRKLIEEGYDLGGGEVTYEIVESKLGTKEFVASTVSQKHWRDEMDDDSRAKRQFEQDRAKSRSVLDNLFIEQKQPTPAPKFRFDSSSSEDDKSIHLSDSESESGEYEEFTNQYKPKDLKDERRQMDSVMASILSRKAHVKQSNIPTQQVTFDDSDDDVVAKPKDTNVVVFDSDSEESPKAFVFTGEDDSDDSDDSDSESGSSSISHRSPLGVVTFNSTESDEDKFANILPKQIEEANDEESIEELKARDSDPSHSYEEVIVSRPFSAEGSSDNDMEDSSSSDFEAIGRGGDDSDDSMEIIKAKPAKLSLDLEGSPKKANKKATKKKSSSSSESSDSSSSDSSSESEKPAKKAAKKSKKDSSSSESSESSSESEKPVKKPVKKVAKKQSSSSSESSSSDSSSESEKPVKKTQKKSSSSSESSDSSSSDSSSEPKKTAKKTAKKESSSSESSDDSSSESEKPATKQAKKKSSSSSESSSSESSSESEKPAKKPVKKVTKKQSSSSESSSSDSSSESEKLIKKTQKKSSSSSESSDSSSDSSSESEKPAKKAAKKTTSKRASSKSSSSESSSDSSSEERPKKERQSESSGSDSDDMDTDIPKTILRGDEFLEGERLATIFKKETTAFSLSSLKKPGSVAETTTVAVSEPLEMKPKPAQEFKTDMMQHGKEVRESVPLFPVYYRHLIQPHERRYGQVVAQVVREAESFRCREKMEEVIESWKESKSQLHQSGKKKHIYAKKRHRA